MSVQFFTLKVLRALHHAATAYYPCSCIYHLANDSDIVSEDGSASQDMTSDLRSRCTLSKCRSGLLKNYPGCYEPLREVLVQGGLVSGSSAIVIC